MSISLFDELEPPKNSEPLLTDTPGLPYSPELALLIISSLFLQKMIGYRGKRMKFKRTQSARKIIGDPGAFAKMT